MVEKGKSSMKKLSDRGFETLMFIALIVAIIVSIIVVNNIQEVQSKKWQQEQGIEVEEKQ